MIAAGQRYVPDGAADDSPMAIVIVRAGPKVIAYRAGDSPAIHRMYRAPFTRNWRLLPELGAAERPDTIAQLSMVIRTLGDVYRHTELSPGNDAALSWAMAELRTIHDRLAVPVIGHVYQDAHYPEDVAVIPLEMQPGYVRVIVGRPERIAALSESDRQTIASNWVTTDHFQRATLPL